MKTFSKIINNILPFMWVANSIAYAYHDNWDSALMSILIAAYSARDVDFS